MLAAASDDPTEVSLRGTRILVITGAWTGLPRALGHLGGQVTVVDHDQRRLEGAVAPDAVEDSCPHALNVPVDGMLPLPSAHFDTVFFDIEPDAYADDRIRAARLTELARVATSRAPIILGMQHPLLSAWRRSRGASRPERIRHVLRACRGGVGRPWNRGLERAGLHPVEALVPARDASTLPALMSRSRARGQLRALEPRGRLESIRRLAATIGLVVAVAPRCVLLAGVGRRPATSMADRLVGRAGMIFPRDSWRVAIDGSTGFAKVALAHTQDDGLRLEVVNTRAAARQPAWAPHVVHGVKFEHADRAGVALFPHLAVRRLSKTAVARCIADVLVSIPEARRAAIGESDLYDEVRHPIVGSNLKAAKCRRLRRWLVERAGAVVAIGPTHGDLIVDNVLLSDAGVRGIDWGRYRPEGALFIDALQAALSEYQRSHDVDLAGSVQAYLDGSLGGPLAELVSARAPGLSRLECVAWLLVHEVCTLQNAVDRPSRRRLRRASREITRRLDEARAQSPTA